MILIFAGNKAIYQELLDLNEGNPDFASTIYVEGFNSIKDRQNWSFILARGYIDKYWKQREAIKKYLSENNIRPYAKPYNVGKLINQSNES